MPFTVLLTQKEKFVDGKVEHLDTQLWTRHSGGGQVGRGSFARQVTHAKSCRWLQRAEQDFPSEQKCQSWGARGHFVQSYCSVRHWVSHSYFRLKITCLCFSFNMATGFACWCRKLLWQTYKKMEIKCSFGKIRTSLSSACVIRKHTAGNNNLLLVFLLIRIWKKVFEICHFKCSLQRMP